METKTVRPGKHSNDGKPAPDPMLLERCDRCGQRAYVVTVHLVMARKGPMEMPLAWCSHHFAANVTKLAQHGSRVVADRREDLLVRS